MREGIVGGFCGSTYSCFILIWTCSNCCTLERIISISCSCPDTTKQGQLTVIIQSQRDTEAVAGESEGEGALRTLVLDLAVIPGLRLILLAHLVEQFQDARTAGAHAAMRVEHGCGGQQLSCCQAASRTRVWWDAIASQVGQTLAVIQGGWSRRRDKGINTEKDEHVALDRSQQSQLVNSLRYL